MCEKVIYPEIYENHSLFELAFARFYLLKMRASSKPKATAPNVPVPLNEEEWTSKMDSVPLDKEFVDSVVMDYLVKEGFQSVAELFSQETGAPLPPDHVSFYPIHLNIENGDVGNAMCQTNEIDPSILENNHQLFCHLQQLQVIKLIADKQTMPALEMAQKELRYRAEEDHSFIPDLEKTLCLLAFLSKPDSPFHYLLTPSYRMKISHDLNSVLLNSHGIEGDSKLHHILKFIDWCEAELAALSIPHPKLTDIAQATIEFPPRV